MSIADIVISLATWIVQKIILPVFPTNLPLLSFASFNSILQGSLKHNLIWAFAGLNNLLNLELLLILLISIIFAEMLFWLVRIGIFVIKLIRG